MRNSAVTPSIPNASDHLPLRLCMTIDVKSPMTCNLASSRHNHSGESLFTNRNLAVQYHNCERCLFHVLY